MATHFKDLKVWESSRQFVKDIYSLTDSFPETEIFGLTSQMRRSAVSIPSNIAEGHSRSGIKDYIHFIMLSIGTASELETHLILSFDLGFINQIDMGHYLRRINEIQIMLHGLRNKLKLYHTPSPHLNA